MKPRKYEKDAAKEFPYSDAEILAQREIVDAYLEYWGVSTTSQNREIVLRGALEKGVKYNTSPDKLFKPIT